MKIISNILCILLLSTSIYAGCGACRMDAKNTNSHHHKKMHKSYTHSPQQWTEWHEEFKASLKLSKSQQKEYENLRIKYDRNITRIQEQYTDDLQKLLSKKQYKQAIKKEEKLLHVPQSL